MSWSRRSRSGVAPRRRGTAGWGPPAYEVALDSLASAVKDRRLRVDVSFEDDMVSFEDHLRHAAAVAHERTGPAGAPAAMEDEADEASEG